MGSDRKKVVPKFGTSGRIWERRRSEESCTEIRYVIEKIENGMEAHQDLVRFLCSKKENMGRII